ncbi:MAG: hypothetical protein QM761_05125 [Pseudoxanthomonas sp.]
MLGWIFDIALETGMRSGEIACLRLHQVDVERRVVLSTGEKLAVALVLKRPDWLASMDYTMAEAIWPM